MSEVQKIAHNTIIQVIGRVISVGIGLLGFGMLTRYLGQVGYGYYTTVYAFLIIFGILIDLGLQMTTTKLISDPKQNESQILSNALTIRLLASIIFLGIAPVVVLLFPYPPIVKIGVAVASVGFVFASLVATLTSLFQKHLIMYKVVIADIVAKILFIIVLITAVKLDLGLTGVIVAFVLDAFLTFIILIYFAIKYVSIRPSFNFAVWKTILKLTWPIALTIALNLIYFKGYIFIMSLLRSPAEVGLYGAPYRVLEVLINTAYLFLGLILPLLATAVAVKNFAKLKTIIQSSFDFLIIFSAPLLVGGFFLGKPLMVLVAGQEFAMSGELIKVLLLATVSIFIAALLGYAIVALEQQKRMIKFYAINAVLSIIGYLIFIPKYSYWGAAWMTVFTEIFILVTAAYVVNQTIQFLPNLKIFFKAVAASVVMAIPLYFLADLHFLILLAGGTLVYFVALYLFKGLDKKIISEIIKIKPAYADASAGKQNKNETTSN